MRQRPGFCYPPARQVSVLFSLDDVSMVSTYMGDCLLLTSLPACLQPNAYH